MAARATCPASAVSDDDSRCFLLALSHDELGMIVDGLSDPLQPVVLVTFSSTCQGLRTPLLAALKVLTERHAKAVALCRKVETSCAALRCATELKCVEMDLTADDMATLSMILQTNGLPQLRWLNVMINGFGDEGAQALCEGLGRGAAPSLRYLNLQYNEFGPVGAEALAAALRRGALSTLVTLVLDDNPIGSEGMAALAAPLHKLPRLNELLICCCEIGDAGMASLVGSLGKDDFKKLERLGLTSRDELSVEASASLIAALNAGAMPKLRALWANAALQSHHAVGDAADDAAANALARAAARRDIEFFLMEYPDSDEESSDDGYPPGHVDEGYPGDEEMAFAELGQWWL